MVSLVFLLTSLRLLPALSSPELLLAVHQPRLLGVPHPARHLGVLLLRSLLLLPRHPPRLLGVPHPARHLGVLLLRSPLLLPRHPPRLLNLVIILGTGDAEPPGQLLSHRVGEGNTAGGRGPGEAERPGEPSQAGRVHHRLLLILSPQLLLSLIVRAELLDRPV